MISNLYVNENYIYLLIADGLLDDGRHDQIVPSLSSPGHISPRSNPDYGIERFSRKVFVGGLPPDIDEGG